MKRTWPGWVVITICSIIPLALWLYYPLNSTSALVNSGKALGIVGYVLFAINILLASRHPLLEKLFFSLGEVYGIHKLLGTISLALLIYHPLLLATQYFTLGTPLAAAYFLPSLANWARTLGTFALVLMEAVLIATLFVKLGYKLWKRLHMYLGLAFVIAYIHIMFVPGDIANDPLLKLYLLAIGAASIAGLIYRVANRRWITPRAFYQLTAITPLSKSITQLTLTPTEQPLRYTAGQFAFVSFQENGVIGESHPYSITSTPDQSALTFVIKGLGDDSRRAATLPVNTIALLEGGFGGFSFTTVPVKQQVWIAGGIGITPFIGLAHSLPADHSATLYYSISDDDDAVLLNELHALESTNFTVVVWNSRKQGRLTAQHIAEHLPKGTDYGVLLCGPVPMQTALADGFAQLGVPREQIYKEDFSLL